MTGPVTGPVAAVRVAVPPGVSAVAGAPDAAVVAEPDAQVAAGPAGAAVAEAGSWDRGG